MTIEATFEKYLADHGGVIWGMTARRRSGMHHGCRPCPARGPLPTAGQRVCDDCQTTWLETAQAMWTRGETPAGTTFAGWRLIDAQRQLASELGMTQRPDRDLRTARWAAPLREQQWTLDLAIEIAWFVRSQDRCVGEFPYERFAARVDLPVPADRAVARVLTLFSEVTNQRWVDANIHRPLARRASMTQSASLDVALRRDVIRDGGQT